jgi:hypothetical protein
MGPTRITDDRTFTLKDGREVRVEYYNGHPAGWFYQAFIGKELVREDYFPTGFCPNFGIAEDLIRQQLEPKLKNPRKEKPKGLVSRFMELLRRAA